jgi:coenzyme F420 hydrogenase subunit beta
MVTALLVHLLEAGRIDGALVTRFVPEQPLQPVPFIARTRSDIIAAARSKYCPVPANMALRSIRQNPGKYAVVGVSCHMHGIRKAAEFDDILRERIVLHIGLFCGHSLSFAATEYLFRQYGIDSAEVRRLEYRGGGWPGGVRVYTKDEKKVFVPHFEAWKLFDVAFTPWRCLLCRDGSAELADISFGDAWLEEFKSDPEGISAIVVRTPPGDIAFRSLVQNKGAAVKAVRPEQIATSQQFFVNKNVYPSVYRTLGFITGRELPQYDVSPAFPGPEDIMSALIRLLGCVLAARPWTRKYLPFLTDEIIPFLSYLKSLPGVMTKYLKGLLSRVRR